MNKRQAKKKINKLVMIGKSYTKARQRKRINQRIFEKLKKDFDDCEKLRSSTLYRQRRKSRRYYIEKWEEENLYDECRNCKNKYSSIECELCVDFDMYEGAVYGKRKG